MSFPTLFTQSQKTAYLVACNPCPESDYDHMRHCLRSLLLAKSHIFPLSPCTNTELSFEICKLSDMTFDCLQTAHALVVASSLWDLENKNFPDSVPLWCVFWQLYEIHPWDAIWFHICQESEREDQAGFYGSESDTDEEEEEDEGQQIWPLCDIMSEYAQRCALSTLDWETQASILLYRDAMLHYAEVDEEERQELGKAVMWQIAKPAGVAWLSEGEDYYNDDDDAWKWGGRGGDNEEDSEEEEDEGYCSDYEA